MYVISVQYTCEDHMSIVYCIANTILHGAQKKFYNTTNSYFLHEAAVKKMHFQK